MDFIGGQNTPYFSWDFDIHEDMISSPLSYWVFREMVGSITSWEGRPDTRERRKSSLEKWATGSK